MKKILVIEDELNIRETLADLLGAKSYSVITACNGEEGMKKALTQKPDLIISDIMMPKKSGLEVLKELIETTESNMPPPFIFLTAKSDHLDIRNGMILGADDYLLKPFKIDDLISTIERNLQKRENLSQEALGSERERISSFLHDGIQQLLVISHLNISRVKSKNELLDEKEVKLLNQSSHVLEQAIEEMRDLSHSLADDKALHVCLEEVCVQFNENELLKVNLDCNSDNPINFEQKYVIVNVIKESLNNILKHSGATEAEIMLRQENGTIKVRIEDNGNGFDSRVKGFGIKRMGEAVERLNGSFNLISQANHGTQVLFQLPLAQ